MQHIILYIQNAAHPEVSVGGVDDDTVHTVTNYYNTFCSLPLFFFVVLHWVRFTPTFTVIIISTRKTDRCTREE